ncbi:MAG: PIN domain-containing protein [Emticicia sp.]|uniref:PIN domain-containing protein n=1 Tax=Emticicia sp. TaxID=1930953 RepID=UPI003BA417DC
MTNYVIDANILMSMLISGNASYKPILEFYDFYLPEFVLVEVEKYKSQLLLRTKMNEDEFFKWSILVFSKITVLPNYILSPESLEKSNLLLNDIDIKDTAYLALSIQLDLPLLTRDKPLATGLRKKGFRRVMMFDDFLRNI